MNVHIAPFLRTLIGAISLPVWLTACGTATISQDVVEDGKSAAELIFPDIAKNSWQPEGSFPKRDDLASVQPGLSKSQLYGLLGRPHFSEGLVHVREWDYTFHFRQDDGSTQTCQFKVLFDKDYLAQSFHWKPAQECPPGAAAPTASAAPEPAPPVPVQTRHILDASVLFAFASATISETGQQRLGNIARQLNEHGDVERVEVIGHTDRIGSDAVNQSLSLQRAKTVKQVLVAHGVAPELITTAGRGGQEPLVACDQTAAPALIACLASNRRVEILVSNTH